MCMKYIIQINEQKTNTYIIKLFFIAIYCDKITGIYYFHLQFQVKIKKLYIKR